MNQHSSSQSDWELALLAEAKRDLVFVFNIVSGAFGGPRPAPAEDEIPALLERVAGFLLAAGCVVGFGYPDTKDFALPEMLGAPGEGLAGRIARFYADDPEEARFLVFAHRVHGESARDA